MPKGYKDSNNDSLLIYYADKWSERSKLFNKKPLFINYFFSLLLGRDNPKKTNRFIVCKLNEISFLKAYQICKDSTIFRQRIENIISEIDYLNYGKISYFRYNHLAKMSETPLINRIENNKSDRLSFRIHLINEIDSIGELDFFKIHELNSRFNNNNSIVNNTLIYDNNLGLFYHFSTSKCTRKNKRRCYSLDMKSMVYFVRMNNKKEVEFICFASVVS